MTKRNKCKMFFFILTAILFILTIAGCEQKPDLPDGYSPVNVSEYLNGSDFTEVEEIETVLGNIRTTVDGFSTLRLVNGDEISLQLNGTMLNLASIPTPIAFFFSPYNTTASNANNLSLISIDELEDITASRISEAHSIIVINQKHKDRYSVSSYILQIVGNIDSAIPSSKEGMGSIPMSLEEAEVIPTILEVVSKTPSDYEVACLVDNMRFLDPSAAAALFPPSFAQEITAEVNLRDIKAFVFTTSEVRFEREDQSVSDRPKTSQPFKELFSKETIRVETTTAGLTTYSSSPLICYVVPVSTESRMYSSTNGSESQVTKTIYQVVAIDALTGKVIQVYEILPVFHDVTSSGFVESPITMQAVLDALFDAASGDVLIDALVVEE